MTQEPAQVELYRANLKAISYLLSPDAFRWHEAGWRGHYRNGAAWSAPVTSLQAALRQELLPGTHFTLTECETILAGGRIEREVLFAASQFWPAFRCPYCANRLRVYFDGAAFSFAEEVLCKYPEGFPKVSVEVNVPSGAIVLGELTDVLPETAAWLGGTPHDFRDYILESASVGCASVFIGSRHAGLFERYGRFTIETRPSAEELEEHGDDASVPAFDSCGQEVVSLLSVCEHWCNLVDKTAFDARVAAYGVSPPNVMIEVRPGVYRFSVDIDADREALAATHVEFEWVREPDPVRDYVAEDLAKHFTATECLIQCFLHRNGGGLAALMKWSALVQAQKVVALAEIADHIMCTVGNGIDWHPNGFPRIAVTPWATSLARDLAEWTGCEFGVLPLLRDLLASWSWYPLTDLSVLLIGAGVQPPSYAQWKVARLERTHVLLAVNLLQYMIEHPESVRPAYEPPPLTLPEALSAYHRLYPELFREVAE